MNRYKVMKYAITSFVGDLNKDMFNLDCMKQALKAC